MTTPDDPDLLCLRVCLRCGTRRPPDTACPSCGTRHIRDAATTDPERDSLTLPGSITGLLRRGSPVVWTGSTVDHRTGVVLDARELDDALVVFGGPSFRCRVDWLALDLTDATGRAHAAWWLEDEISRDAWMSKPLMSRPATPKLAWFRRDTCPWAGLVADLDPKDPFALDDWSRRVDAEALRRVVLHVAGRTDAR